MQTHMLCHSNHFAYLGGKKKVKHCVRGCTNIVHSIPVSTCKLLDFVKRFQFIFSDKASFYLVEKIKASHRKSDWMKVVHGCRNNMIC